MALPNAGSVKRLFRRKRRSVEISHIRAHMALPFRLFTTLSMNPVRQYSQSSVLHKGPDRVGLDGAGRVEEAISGVRVQKESSSSS